MAKLTKNDCDKGKPCGTACIEKSDQCKQTSGKEASSALDANAMSLSQPKKLIASGNYGNVYLQGNVLIKESKEAGKGIGVNEAAIQKKAAKLGVAPAVLSSSDSTLAMGAWMPAEGWRAGKNYKPVKSINEAERKSITAQLETLHANDIAHNDMHSGNVFVNRKAGKTGIIDYGLSKTSDEEGYASAILGDLGKGSAAVGGFEAGSKAQIAADALKEAKALGGNKAKLARAAIVLDYTNAIKQSQLGYTKT